MSFYINDTALKSAYYNGSEVKSIYYNGTEVWKSDAWPGWSSATWEDIYNLCKQKQEGEITAWPSDVVVGATKTVTLSTAVCGVTSVTMMLIGIDIDGSGVLTFHSKYGFATATAFGADGCYWADSTVRSLCQSFYNYCNVKSYIKTLSKGYSKDDPRTSRNGTATYTDETVWLLSERELGLDANSPISVANSSTTNAECTYGVNAAYPYYNSATRRIKYKSNATSTKVAYWTRSKSMYNYMYHIGVNTSGASEYLSNTATYYFAPAFAIG